MGDIMSNIRLNDKCLNIIGNFINSDINLEMLEEVIKCLVPYDKDECLINLDIKEKGSKAAIFRPQYKCLSIGINKLNSWLLLNSESLASYYNINNDSIFKNYLLLFVVCHEIEHSYQYLMGEGIILAPNKMIKLGYKGLLDLLKKQDYIIPRPIKQTRRAISLILYKRNENGYVLERNANIEALDLLCKIALYFKHDDMYRVFNDMKNTFMIAGYKNDNKGSLAETYRSILMNDYYQKIYEDVEMDEKEKARYGLEISMEERQKILKLERGSK